MSAITYNWASLAIEAEVEFTTNSPMKIKSRCSREEEFRAALNTYLAEYRRNRDLITDKTIHLLQKNQIPLSRRTAQMLWFQPWF